MVSSEKGRAHGQSQSQSQSQSSGGRTRALQPVAGLRGDLLGEVPPPLRAVVLDAMLAGEEGRLLRSALVAAAHPVYPLGAHGALDHVPARRQPAPAMY
eukprot:1196138-Prorocentrum_minimum.AAC.3